MTDRLSALAATARRRAAAARERRQLRADLASYHSGAHRDDLLATLDRYPNEVADPIRRLMPTRWRDRHPPTPSYAR